MAYEKRKSHNSTAAELCLKGIISEEQCNFLMNEEQNSYAYESDLDKTANSLVDFLIAIDPKADESNRKEWYEGYYDYLQYTESIEEIIQDIQDMMKKEKNQDVLFKGYDAINNLKDFIELEESYETWGTLEEVEL